MEDLSKTSVKKPEEKAVPVLPNNRAGIVALLVANGETPTQRVIARALETRNRMLEANDPTM